MAEVSRQTLEWIFSLVGSEWKKCHTGFKDITLYYSANCRSDCRMLLTVVLLSWGYVIYATRIAAQWQLQKDYPTETHKF